MMRKLATLFTLVICTFGLTSSFVSAQNTTTDDDDSRPRASITLTKSVSVDGRATWDDAEVAPGPTVAVRAPVSFLLEVYNDGEVPLTDITLADSAFRTNECAIPATLAPETGFDCVLGPFESVEGQHRNVATVTALADTQLVTDADSAHYFGGSLVRLLVDKSVSVNGGPWNAADSAPGLTVREGQQVSFRIIVSNEGTVPLTNLTLADSQYSTGGCNVPSSLAAGAGFECVLGPFPVTGTGGKVNTATATARAGDETVTVSNDAHYTVRARDDKAVIIIIEGPVKEIINNIIIIYDVRIRVDVNDPILKVIRIGDIVRIEGEVIDDNGDDDDDNGTTTIIIVAIVIIIIDVDVVIVNDQVWRDDGDCRNPPPPWAPAHGWRARCQVIIIDGDRGRGNPGRGRGRGRGDDDDDD